MVQSMLFQLLDGVAARVIGLRLRRHDLVEQFALPVLLSRLHVCLRNRDRLAKGAAALRRDDDHAGARRTLERDLPLVPREISLSGHATLPLARSNNHRPGSYPSQPSRLSRDPILWLAAGSS
jgi:hypothetical protein